MKHIFTAIFLSLVLFGCTDTKKQEEDLLNDVIKIHDQVMAKEQTLMTNKMKLDTLVKSKGASDVKAAGTEMVKTLEQTDEQMEDWMHKFDAENKGKSHDQIMEYLTDQKKKITAIDKQFDTNIATSTNYIKQYASK